MLISADDLRSATRDGRITQDEELWILQGLAKSHSVCAAHARIWPAGFAGIWEP
jgi:hypothetical protein